MTDAFIGHGTLLQRKNDAAAWETISEVVSFEPPDQQADEHEVSHYESLNRKKEFIGGMIDPGEVAFSVNYNPSTHPLHATLKADHSSGEIRDWRFVLPDAIETWSFSGFIKGFKLNVPVNGPVTADLMMRVTGDVTIT